MEKILQTTLFLVLFLFTASYGQTDSDREEQAKKIAESSEYVFEANLVPNTYRSYFNSDSTQTYGAWLIQIKKVYKGNLIPGTIELIYEGANISYMKNGRRRSVTSYDTKWPVIEKDTRYIFFASRSSFPEPHGSNSNNAISVTLPFGYDSYIIWPSTGQEKFVGPAKLSKFETEHEVYKYLQSFPSISIPDSVVKSAAKDNLFLQQRNDSKQQRQYELTEATKALQDSQKPELIILDSISHYRTLIKIYEAKEKYQNMSLRREIRRASERAKYWENKYDRLKKKRLSNDDLSILLSNRSNSDYAAKKINIQKSTNATSSTYDFTWEITNEKFDASQSSYGFDVYGSVSQAVYVDWVQLYLDYNPSVFGFNVGTNQKIIVTNADGYQNYATVAIDHDENTAVIAFLASTTNTRPYKIARLLDPNSPPQFLFRVVIKTIENLPCYTPTNLNFNTSLISQFLSSNTFGTTREISESFTFDNIYVGDIISSKTCSTDIKSITYSDLEHVGGKSTVITIRGGNFYSIRSSGRVVFKNADDGGQTNLSDGDAFDYVSWSEDEIKIKVPSGIISANDATPGTGKIMVQNSSGYKGESGEDVEIKYSLLNFLDYTENEKYPFFLRNQDASGGITFRLGTGVSTNAEARAAIEHALKEWSCNLNIDLKLGADFSGGKANDGQNVISLGLPAGNAGMQTYQALETCPGNSKELSTYSDIDIVINSGTSWFYDDGTSNVPSGKFDFYAALLHELGHVLGLRHVNDPADLMYWSQTNGAISASQRKKVRNSIAHVAAMDVVQRSKSVNWNCSLASGKTLSNAIAPRTCNGLVVGINDRIAVNGPTMVIPGSLLTYNGTFISSDGTTYPTQWNWTLKLYHGGGAYTYASRTVNTTVYDGNTNNWSFVGSAVPEYAWVRTNNNKILGEVIVTTIDNNGDPNESKVQVELEFKPNIPEISQISNTTNTLSFFYNSPGANSYKIHYSTISGGPYNGSGAAQGNSPINVAVASSFTLTNLNLLQNTYYVKVEAINTAGSTFSPEFRSVPVVIATWPTSPSYLSGQTFSVPFISAGFTTNTVFTAWLSDASGNFTNKVNLGNFTGALAGTIPVVIPINIPAGNGYRIKISANSPELLTKDNGFDITIKPFLSIASGNVSQSFLCAGSSSMINFNTSNTFVGTYNFTAELSDANGIFSNPIKIGERLITGLDGPTNLFVRATTPLNSITGTSYRIRISCPELAIIGTENSNFSIKGLPIVTSNPVNKTVCEGTTTTFAISATGENLTYVWQASLNGVFQSMPVNTYSGINTNTLTVAVNYGLNNYDYRCVVSSGDCYSVSNWGKLMVEKPISIAGITSPLCAGNNFMVPFTTNSCATFNPGNIFKAQLSDGSGNFSSPTDIGSLVATTSGSIIAAIPSNVSGESYRIRIVSSNPAKIGNDNGVNLNILESIKTLSVGNSICTGISFTIPFSLTSCNAFNAGNIFTAQLSDPTGNFSNSTLIGTLTSTTSGNISAIIPNNTIGGIGYRIRVVSSNPYSVGSNNGVNISINMNQSPQITIASPRMGGVCAGESLTFTSTITNGGPNPLYQWKRNGLMIQGATSSTFTSTTLAANDVISCEMTTNSSCAVGLVASSNSITVVSGALAPIIIKQPQHTPTCGNQPVAYNVIAGGNNLTYRWQYISNGSWTDIPEGATQFWNGIKTANLTVTSHPANIGGQYRCKVSGACVGYSQAAATTYTDAVTQTILGSIISLQPSNKVVCSGQNTSFVTYVNLTSGTTTYKWKRVVGSSYVDLTETAIYGTNVSGSGLGIRSAPLSINGYQYICEIGNTLGNCPVIYSNIVTLTVNSCPAPASVAMNSEGARFLTDVEVNMVEKIPFNSPNNRFSIHPNPTNDALNISNIGEGTGIRHLRLVNIIGTLILETNWDVCAERSITLDLIGQPNGVYLLYIDNQIYKVIKN